MSEGIEAYRAALDAAVAYVQAAVPGPAPKMGIVLGSGLGDLVEAMDVAGAVSYADIPGFPRSTVEGHAGKLVIGDLSGVRVAVMQGRVHLYEGYPISEVVFPVRVLVKLGVEGIIVTNAAGSVNPEFDEREIMLITDHINLSGHNPLYGPNDPTLGPRFPDMSTAYDATYLEAARGVGVALDIPLREGVYVGLLGPSYETPAEVQMLHRLGGDAVGMSTVNEVIAARHMGARVLGISCISNKGAGLSKTPLSHDEVKAAGEALKESVIALVGGVVARLGQR
ncbi:MAG: purine-nucleoside phosphorylase [Myxococcales bacterium]|nr:purine-nucleoside phosphorylase [Myxococcales bacterium]MCB9645501.1 purine-nucleoside phosphorylase [Deltaproteobacteria bacterium]